MMESQFGTQEISFQTEYIGRFNVSVSSSVNDSEIDSFKFESSAPYLNNMEDLISKIGRPGVLFTTVLEINNFTDVKNIEIKASDDKGLRKLLFHNSLNYIHFLGNEIDVKHNFYDIIADRTLRTEKLKEAIARSTQTNYDNLGTI